MNELYWMKNFMDKYIYIRQLDLTAITIGISGGAVCAAQAVPGVSES